MTTVVLAVDIGGTKTAVGLLDAAFTVLGRESGPTPAKQGPDAVIAQVASLAEALCARHPDATIVAVGVASAGVVDVGTGTIISSTDTFTNWPGTNIAERLRAALRVADAASIPIHVQNDVDAHGTGEALAGAARGYSSALVVAVGTGIGASLILDGAVVRGAHHVAGEIGHVPTPGAEHLRCPCGRMGHLEAIGSGVGLHQHYLWLGGHPSATSAREVVTGALGADAIARTAIIESAQAVGRALAGLATFADPGCIVLTGGVADIGELWWAPVRETFAAEVIDALADVPLRSGELGGDAPLVGAAASAWNLVRKDTA